MAGFCREAAGPAAAARRTRHRRRARAARGHDRPADAVAAGADAQPPAPPRGARRQARARGAAACRAAALPGLDRMLAHGAKLVFRPVDGRAAVGAAQPRRPRPGPPRFRRRRRQRQPRAGVGEVRAPLAAPSRSAICSTPTRGSSARCCCCGPTRTPPIRSTAPRRRSTCCPTRSCARCQRTGFLIAYDDPVGVARELIAFCGLTAAVEIGRSAPSGVGRSSRPRADPARSRPAPLRPPRPDRLEHHVDGLLDEPLRAPVERRQPRRQHAPTSGGCRSRSTDRSPGIVEPELPGGGVDAVRDRVREAERRGRPVVSPCEHLARGGGRLARARTARCQPARRGRGASASAPTNTSAGRSLVGEPAASQHRDPAVAELVQMLERARDAGPVVEQHLAGDVGARQRVADRHDRQRLCELGPELVRRDRPARRSARRPAGRAAGRRASAGAPGRRRRRRSARSGRAPAVRARPQRRAAAATGPRASGPRIPTIPVRPLASARAIGLAS